MYPQWEPPRSQLVGSTCKKLVSLAKGYLGVKGGDQIRGQGLEKLTCALGNREAGHLQSSRNIMWNVFEIDQMRFFWLENLGPEEDLWVVCVCVGATWFWMTSWEILWSGKMDKPDSAWLNQRLMSLRSSQPSLAESKMRPHSELNLPQFNVVCSMWDDLWGFSGLPLVCCCLQLMRLPGAPRNH